MKPIISIIVPVYNSEEYLEKCIESILNQTFKSFELILVNDGSTDSSKEICDKYRDMDKRVITIHKQNEGQASARNYGLEIAQGEYIGFVDSDDWIEINMFEVLYNACIKEDADISIMGLRELNESKTYYFEYIPKSIELNEILKRAYPWNKLFKRSLFINHELKFTSGRYYEDLELIPKLFIESKKNAIVSKIGYNYLKRSDSTTNTKDKKILDLLWAYTEIKKYLISKNYYRQYEEEFKKSIKYLYSFYANILYSYPMKFVIRYSKEIVNYFEELDYSITKYEIMKFILIYLKKNLRVKVSAVVRKFI